MASCTSAVLWANTTPAGGGTLLSGGVQVLTTSSPLGRALLGKRVDDEVELRLPGKSRTLVISAIS